MSLKFIAGLLIGATATAAILYFLETEEGKALTAKLKAEAGKVEEDILAMADDMANDPYAFMNDLEKQVDKATS